eukprot:27320-Eustigmatos_ZCMA.PRE.1
MVSVLCATLHHTQGGGPLVGAAAFAVPIAHRTLHLVPTHAQKEAQTTPPAEDAHRPHDSSKHIRPLTHKM